MPDSIKYPSGVSIVLPAYNEEENIETAIERCFAILKVLGCAHEVIVVNDGSSDLTRTICNEIEKSTDNLRIIDFETNRGYGAALRAGIKTARYAYVFYTDADNQFDVSELKYLLPMIDTYDLVIGFRVYRYDRFLRLFLSWGYNLLIRIFLRIRVQDIDCAFKLFRREIFDNVELHADDFFIDTEIVIKAQMLGYSLNEVGVRHYPRVAGKTTVRPSDIPRTLKTLAQIWMQTRSLKKSLKKQSKKEVSLPEIIV
jgi:glycosyltransferase involved in cell wall biosynthesis